MLDDAPAACAVVRGRSHQSRHNAVDRHLATRGFEQPALVPSPPKRASMRTTYTYRQLHREANRMAATQALGVKRGDRVLVYRLIFRRPHSPRLACARIGAIHRAFGGFASNSFATRARRCHTARHRR